jgi:hypothetical protein
MSVQAHLAALERQHQTLKQQIDAEQTHPSCDDLKVGELKRCKLVVKDEIASVQQRAGIVSSGVKSAGARKRAAVLRMAKHKSSDWYQGAAQSISIKSKSP